MDFQELTPQGQGAQADLPPGDSQVVISESLNTGRLQLLTGRYTGDYEARDYLAGDMAKYNGVIYLCHTAHTATAEINLGRFGVLFDPVVFGADNKTVKANASDPIAGFLSSKLTVDSSIIMTEVVDGTTGARSYILSINGDEAVQSWNGRVGAVVPEAGDYTAAQVTFTPSGSVTAEDVQTAIEQLDSLKITGEDVWPVVLELDGHGSGLDADMLDGQHAAFFASYDQLNELWADAEATFALIGHNHDGTYSPVGHNHDGTYSPVGHNHDASYASIGHNHDGVYSPEGHTHSSGDITNFTEQVHDSVASMLVEGTNITIVYDDLANTLTISAAPGEAANGLPAGGTTSQILAKASGTDYDAEWIEAPVSGSPYLSIQNVYASGYIDFVFAEVPDPLPTIDLHGLHRVVELSINSFGCAIFDLTNNPDMTGLYLDGGNGSVYITEVTPESNNYDVHVFSGFPDLTGTENLQYLSFMEYTSFDPVDITGEGGTIESVTYYNNIFDPAELPLVTDLELKGDLFFDLDFSTNSTQFVNIYLQTYQCTAVDFSGLTNCVSLGIGGINSNMVFSGMSSIDQIEVILYDMVDVGPFTGDFTGLSTIRYIRWSADVLGNITLTGCTGLEILMVESDVITDLIDFEDCVNVNSISIDFCPSLTSAVVDAILVALDTNGGINGNYSGVNGGTPSPTATGLAAKASLEGKGWYVGIPE